MASIIGQGYQTTSVSGGVDINLLDDYYNNTWTKDKDITSTKNITCQNLDVNGTTNFKGTVNVINVSDVNIEDRTVIFGKGTATSNRAIAFDGIPGGYVGLVASGVGSDPILRVFQTTQSIEGQVVSFSHPGYTRGDLQTKQLFSTRVRVENSNGDSNVWLSPTGTSYFGSLDTVENDNMMLGVGIQAPTAKLHINNTSANNSFLVEDDTNPDSTPFVIDNAGNVGIGTLSPLNPLSVRLNGSNVSPVNLEAITPSASFGCDIQTSRAKGTAGAPGAVGSGDVISAIYNRAHNGTGYGAYCTAIRSVATEAHTATASGARLDFGVTPNGTTSRAISMVIDQNGRIGLGGVFIPSARIHSSVANSDDTWNLSRTTDDANGHVCYFVKQRGTSATPTALLNNDNIFVMYANGRRPAATHATCAIRVNCTENWTDTAAGGAIYFDTTQNGTVSRTTKMTLTGEGRLGLGTTTPTELLQVQGNAIVNNILTVNDLLIAPRKATAPTTGVINGAIYYDTATNKLRVYANGVWVDLH